MYCLLALSALRRLMVEVVNTVGLKGSTVATYAPVVTMELRNQIDDWYQHLPKPLKFPPTHTFLFDKRRAYLRSQYQALIAVVFWPFVPRSKEMLLFGQNGEDSERVMRGADECLKAARDFLKGAEEILTQKTVDSHVIVRSYFTMAVMLLFTLPSQDSDCEATEDHLLLEEALQNLSHWDVVPFMKKPLEELERMALSKGIKGTSSMQQVFGGDNIWQMLPKNPDKEADFNSAMKI
ncbi:hypothetical protein W97_08563 [Coniosporium apollinis CBS 100218]|uniref:Uncharacterized protein n=1 Tax=Coniosporium apollinis (strain CBS 100218) TaxID=1168221 RepID=R7Z5B6_CONA1|nr:uncharacterized protein W97_08563 [Coniosporium apollinis CBS 100218]EON69204.1 hypothetical protein W97_08563 [Coniosporium apollinis CBS 100218]